MSEFDVIVIGGGPGGYVCAIRAAQLGLKVACVEFRGALGGTCLNVGCIPSKALLESSHLYHKAKHEFDTHGISTTKLNIDIAKMLEHKSKTVKTLTGGIEGLLKKNKVTYLKGRGSFVDKNTVKVTEGDGAGEYKAKNIVIATGSEPIELPFAKYDGDKVVSSTEALDFESVPKHLIVVGGGVIGLELGSVWCRLGAKVTVIEAQKHIAGGIDTAVAKAFQRTLEKQGLEFHCETMLKELSTSAKQVKIVCDKKGESVEFKGDKCLIAVGRRPYTKGLNCEAAGVKLDERGRVEIDDHFRTSTPGVFAIGDVVKGAMLAHKAEEEGVALAENLAGKVGHVNYLTIPGVIYTHPEVATVGYSEEQLKEMGTPFKAGKFPFMANGRAKAMAETEGFIKILAHKETDRILGIHIIGAVASEMIAEAVLAMEYCASAEDIARTVHAHPTLSEAMKEAALGVAGEAIHI